MRYNYLLFDLDGTLTDPGEGITNSVAYALSKFGIKCEDRTLLYKFIGPPLRQAFEKYYGFSTQDSISAVVYYREYFSERGIFENRLYDGVCDMLSRLSSKGAKILLATSKPTVFAARILDHFGISRHFSLVCGSELDGGRARKAEVIKYALSEYGILRPSEAIMIGDREHDIKGAAEAGIDAIGVSWGYGSAEELKSAAQCHAAMLPNGEAVRIAQTLSQLEEMLR